MAIDPRISLAANAGNLGGAIGQGLLNARNIQAIQDRPLQNRLLQAQAGQAEQELSDAQQKAELQSIARGVFGLDKFLQQGDLQGAENFLSEREAGGPTIEGGRGMVDTQEMREFMQPREGETEAQRLERVRSRTNELKEGLFSLGVAERPPMSKEDETFIKGEVDLVRTGTQDLKKRAGVINTQINKIRNLKDQMGADQKLPRSAINAGIMSLARMISPGVVTDKDAAAVAGVANPYQAGIQLFDKMIERGADPEKVERARVDFVRAFDPANPETFNAEGFEAIANAVAGAEAGTILQDWKELKARAERGNLGERVMAANFGGDNESIFSLQKFTNQGAAAGPVDAGDGFSVEFR